MKQRFALYALLLLSSCSGGKQTAEAPNNSPEGIRQVEQEAKSIEQAADEAAKLIEDDARKNEPTP
jgi:hypothetical protein